MGQRATKDPAYDFVENPNPLDIIEQTAENQRFPYERNADCELILLSGGKWTDQRLCFTFLPDCEALQLMLIFEPRVPERHIEEVLRLIARMNANNWLGHFDYLSDEQLVLFRYGMPLRDSDLTVAQSTDLIELALEACDSFFPALQYVLWGGMKADDAVSASLFETAGEAAVQASRS